MAWSVQSCLRRQRQRVHWPSDGHVGLPPWGAVGLQQTRQTNGQQLSGTFNGTLRDECLNVHWLASLAEAQRLLEAWRRDYNESRPHSALEYLTPAEYARKIKELKPV